MTDFGDYEPEDAWDADDPTPLLLDNLDRRCTAMAAPRLLAEVASHDEWLDELEERVTVILTRRSLSDADRARAELIADDIDMLCYRLDFG